MRFSRLALPVAVLVSGCVDVRIVDDWANVGGGGGGGSSGQGGSDPTGGSSVTNGGGPEGGASVAGSSPQGGGTTTGAFCGDGKIDPGETCDSADLGGQSCISLGFSGGALGCSMGCTFDTSACTTSGCGDGVLDPGEACDDGNTASGDGCSASCQIELTACQAATPVMLAIGSPVTMTGNTTGATALESGAACNAAGPEVAYAVTAGADGFITAWITNAGTGFDSVLYARSTCDSAASEILCHDNSSSGADAGEVVSSWVNAGDTVYYFVDGATAGASGGYEIRFDLSRGGSCGDTAPVTIEGAVPVVLRGSTTGLSPDTTAFGCNGSGGGADAVYEMTFAAAGTYTLDLVSNNFNTVSYARTDCGTQSSEVDCDAPPMNNNSQLVFTVAAGDVRFVWVDGSTGSSGTYTLTVSH